MNSSCAHFTGMDIELTPAFEIDFAKEQLGRPHHMKFTANPPQMASLLQASAP